MQIYLFGQGSLGKIIKQNLLINSSTRVTILPLKETHIDEYLNVLLNKKQKKIIIDLMDPNAVGEDTDKGLISKAKIIRENLSNVQNLRQYIYISTASIYKSSLKKIDENSLLKLKSLSSYEKLKLNNEKKLKKAKVPLTICRVPNIWGIKSDKKSFFNDLFNAYSKKNKIKYLDNDKNVISYLYVNDLISLIILIISKRIFGVVNLSTNSFDTRYNLKARVNSEKIESINNTMGVRLTSIKLDSSKYIKGKRIEF